MVEVVIQRAVTEYRIMGETCTCGRVQRSAFPEGVTATVQYGPGVSALAVYLTQSQLLPYQGTASCSRNWPGLRSRRAPSSAPPSPWPLPPGGAGGGHPRRTPHRAGRSLMPTRPAGA